MDEITVRDLLAWDPRFNVSGAGISSALAPVVSWAVAARAMAPALPALRGGEVILLPEAFFAEQDGPIQVLLTDLARQRIAAVIVDAGTERLNMVAGQIPLPVLIARGARVSVELESDLNRLLTERRGEIYRLGTELGRLLSSLTASGASLQRTVELASEQISMPIVVTDRNGVILSSVATGAAAETESGKFEPPAADLDWIEHPLRGGGRVWLGPVPPVRHAQARMAADRLTAAIEAALVEAKWFRPRGPERADALKRFILSASRCELSDARVQAVALGLDPTAMFQVLLSRSASALLSYQRLNVPTGVVHELARFEQFAALLIEGGSVSVGVGAGEGRRHGSHSRTRPPVPSDDWVAATAPAAGLAELTEAARQAQFVAGLLDTGLIQRPTAAFDRAAEIGGYRLLYSLWGREELTSYAAEILGGLLEQDRNGVLRQTLLQFLESGGSRVEAATRTAIHRNTLSYRLRRITELTNLDPTAPGDRMALHLAVLAMSLPPIMAEAGR